MAHNKKHRFQLPEMGLLALLINIALVLLCQSAVADSVADSIYTGTIQPLTLEECARCHATHYNWLKNNGAMHQTVACTECHEVFHAYNPLRNNYKEIMPKFDACHSAPHGTAEPVMQCLECHVNPHQPLVSIPTPDSLEGRCQLCHTGVAASLQAEVSKHTEQECSSCHSQKHGRIPQCAECHENHSPLAALETVDCLACHPVHTPLNISYPVTQGKEVCAGCHGEAYQLLQANQTKHSALTCAKCHPNHGQLPACQDCHGEPHNRTIHEKYAKCGDCHGIAHNVGK
jgi:predicted CXXCH cytochrome family protein